MLAAGGGVSQAVFTHRCKSLINIVLVKLFPRPAANRRDGSRLKVTGSRRAKGNFNSNVNKFRVTSEESGFARDSRMASELHKRIKQWRDSSNLVAKAAVGKKS